MDVHALIEDQIIPQIKQPIWDSWWIKEKIGSGAFSNVYRVEARRTNMVDEYALKVSSIVSDRVFSTEDGKKSFIEQKKLLADTESIIMKKLNDCPYIVKYYDEKMQPFYVNGSFEGYYSLIRMELLTPLTSAMREGTFSYNEENVRKLASEIGQALQYAHQRNIIHRDVKLDNLFISKENTYKLADFNVSKNGGSAHSFAGSPGYMAPEIFCAKSNPDESYSEQADIYSLGICLYQIMNNSYFPLESEIVDTDTAITRRMNGEGFPPPSEASEDFGRIINKACAFDTSNRYQNMAELLSDLDGRSQNNVAGKSDPFMTNYAGNTDPGETRYAAPAAPDDKPKKEIKSPTPSPKPEKQKKKIGGIIALAACLILVASASAIFIPRLLDSKVEEKPSENNTTGFVSCGDSEYVVMLSSAHDEGTEVARLYSGQPLEIDQIEGDWYYVKYGEIEGYIKVTNVIFTSPENQLESIPETSTISPVPTTETTMVTETTPHVTEPPIKYDPDGIAYPSSYSDYIAYGDPKIGYISISSSNVYKDASTNYSRGEANKLYSGDGVELYGIYNGFYYISAYSGSGYDIFGYIPVKNVTLGTPPSLSDAYYTASEGYVSVQSCNVRSSPSKASNTNITDTLCNGTIFTIDSFDGYWYHIYYSGRSGYISYKMITPGASPAVISPSSGYVSSDSCNLRCSPSKDNNKNIIGTLAKDTVFTATHYDGYWYYITYTGGSGYVSHKMVTIGSAPAATPSVDTSSVEVYSCNKTGEINGNDVAGFATSYVCENGSKSLIRERLGNSWHVTAVRYCYSRGLTWYELYDTDDGDYYGWVDSNYILFY